MQRRTFFKSLFSAVPALSLFGLVEPLAVRAKQSRSEVLLQTSPVAGFQYYDGDLLWDTLRQDDVLRLVPEPENQHDDQAVKVMWNDNQLGYIPRRDNTAISQMLQRGQPLIARIGELQQSSNPWERVTMHTYLVQGLRNS